MSNLPPLDDPSKWQTGGDPMTDKQAGFINVLADQTGKKVDLEGLDKGSASQKIEELKSEKEGGGGTEEAGKQPEQKETTSSAPPQPDSDSYLQHPKQWVTGGDPATAKQKAFLKTLDGGVETEGMSKADASEKIEELK